MPITPISGKDGTVKIGANSVGAITGWSMKKGAHIDDFASSEVPGFGSVVTGVKRASGTVDGKWDSADDAALVEGASVTLDLNLTASRKYVVPAVIENIDIKVDINDGTAITFSATFRSNGAWTEPSFA